MKLHIFKQRSLAILLLLSGWSGLWAASQSLYQTMNSAEQRMEIAKLKTLGSVLYIGAHPDDENTGLIAYLAKDRLLETAYLSLTRGDGGQNLLGSEQSERLGLIRTQELLAARRIDGGRQFFTRAIDFGYSKSADETLAIWDRQLVLADIVWIIRRFQPDVIVFRFQPGSDGGHGHHTASAILAKEAYLAAADSTSFPEQLKFVRPWQARRLYWNSWRVDPAQMPQVRSIDIGGYNPLLGRSYTEIAGESRSMHKSQGFGSAERRGSRIEQFLPIAGDTASSDPFANLGSDWSRIQGGRPINQRIDAILAQFDETHPAVSLPALVALYNEISKLPSCLWVERKQRDLSRIIQDAAGLWLEVIADDYRAVPGNRVRLTATAVLREAYPVRLSSIRWPWTSQDSQQGQLLATQQPLEIKQEIDVPLDTPISQPYWLQLEPLKGTYQIRQQLMAGEPEPFEPITASVELEFSGQVILLQVPVAFRWTDPVEGENYRPLLVTPPVTAHLDRPLYVFNGNRPKSIRLTVHGQADSASGEVRLQLPDGWRANPSRQWFTLTGKDGEQEFEFIVSCAGQVQSGKLAVILNVAGKTWGEDLVEIRYSHIPVQTFFPACGAGLLRLPSFSSERRIGYIMGSGDDIPELLRQLGFSVALLQDEDLTDGHLNNYDVIIAGVRAYNTRPRLARAMDALMKFVERGGVYIVQYNTNSRLVSERIGPYPLRISRDRVTVEDAPVSFLLPGHPLLNMPFKIAAGDFNGWIQERGLYFADQWDEKYQAPLECHDPGEKEKSGGLLAARYGRGYFIFSAYAWFRQLPAGVPGAYKLFLNMVLANSGR